MDYSTTTYPGVEVNRVMQVERESNSDWLLRTARLCSLLCDCGSFNTDGWLKKLWDSSKLEKVPYFTGTNQGIFIRDVPCNVSFPPPSPPLSPSPPSSPPAPPAPPRPSPRPPGVQGELPRPVTPKQSPPPSLEGPGSGAGGDTSSRPAPWLSLAVASLVLAVMRFRA